METCEAAAVATWCAKEKRECAENICCLLWKSFPPEGSYDIMSQSAANQREKHSPGASRLLPILQLLLRTSKTAVSRLPAAPPAKPSSLPSLHRTAPAGKMNPPAFSSPVEQFLNTTNRAYNAQKTRRQERINSLRDERQPILWRSSPCSPPSCSTSVHCRLAEHRWGSVKSMAGMGVMFGGSVICTTLPTQILTDVSARGTQSGAWIALLGSVLLAWGSS